MLLVGIATGAYGISFGALSVAAGLSVLQTQALSALMFTGGSQFAFVGVVAAGGAGSAAIATATLLGIRNGLYGLQVTTWLGARGLRRAAAAQLTIDESTAVGMVQPEPAGRRLGFWTTGLAVFVLRRAMRSSALVSSLTNAGATWPSDALTAGVHHGRAPVLTVPWSSIQP